MDISIIVPIYKGKKYINDIVNQIEKCVKKLDGQQVELLLVNDYPKDILENQKSKLISIRVFNTDKNLGIHGARIKGIRFCEGKYILMLDQDDRISDNYLKSQMKVISDGNADAVICRARENGRSIYNVSNPFERTVDINYMYTGGNAIVSPGQVLLKKESISQMWLENILTHSGADDWFLWLCMFAEGKRMVLNDEELYEHVISGNNFSWNSEEMIQSENEIYDFFDKRGICDKILLAEFKRLIEHEQIRYIKILEKYRRLYLLYDRWMYNVIKKEQLTEFLYKQGNTKVAIYGMGELGQQVAMDLTRDDRIILEAIIDMNADYIDSDFKLVTLDKFQESVDLIIVTVACPSNDLVNKIKRKTCTSVITFDELLASWERA